jgi:hypothetical protein
MGAFGGTTHDDARFRRGQRTSQSWTHADARPARSTPRPLPAFGSAVEFRLVVCPAIGAPASTKPRREGRTRSMIPHAGSSSSRHEWHAPHLGGVTRVARSSGSRKQRSKRTALQHVDVAVGVLPPERNEGLVLVGVVPASKCFGGRELDEDLDRVLPEATLYHLRFSAGHKVLAAVSGYRRGRFSRYGCIASISLISRLSRLWTAAGREATLRVLWSETPRRRTSS